MNATTDAVSDQYQFWRRRMAGEDVPIHDGDVHAGFYRLKARAGGTDQPVAYWFRDGVLRCRIGGKDVDEQIARERWMWAQKFPITHELYKAIAEGGHWPDQSEAVSRSNNAPQDGSFEYYASTIEELVREAQAMIDRGAAATQEDADRAADLANGLMQLGKQAPELLSKDSEITPELKAAATTLNRLTTRWHDTAAKTKIYSQIKSLVLGPFLIKKRDEEAKAREEAARTNSAPPQVERKPVKAGTRGKAISLRTVTTVTITDRAALLAYFSDREEITDLLQSMAEKAVRAGVTPTGVKVEKDQQAA